ncbi:hypothetical protein J6590_026805 [Homalodisca vitripennis]|nr:hypothetical protein J6590_026805 [Homalodisca vitripennis]
MLTTDSACFYRFLSLPEYKVSPVIPRLFTAPGPSFISLHLHAAHLDPPPTPFKPAPRTHEVKLIWRSSRDNVSSKSPLSRPSTGLEEIC